MSGRKLLHASVRPDGRTAHYAPDGLTIHLGPRHACRNCQGWGKGITRDKS